MLIPDIQASWRGEKVKSGGLTFAPYSNSSCTHSRLPAAQASHSGVLPSMLRASTWRPQVKFGKRLKLEKKDIYCFAITAAADNISTTYSLSPVHQRQAAVWHTGPVHVCMPHVAGWWSPRPRCLRLHRPQWVAAAGGPGPVQRPHALLIGLSRSQDHGLEECKIRLYKAFLFHTSWPFVMIITENFDLISRFIYAKFSYLFSISCRKTLWDFL